MITTTTITTIITTITTTTIIGDIIVSEISMKHRLIVAATKMLKLNGKKENLTFESYESSFEDGWGGGIGYVTFDMMAQLEVHASPKTNTNTNTKETIQHFT